MVPGDWWRKDPQTSACFLVDSFRFGHICASELFDCSRTTGDFEVA